MRSFRDDSPARVFSPGQVFEYEATIVRIVRIDDNVALLTDVFGKRSWEVTRAEVESMPTFALDAIDKVTKKDWDRAQLTAAMLKDVISLNITSRSGLVAISKKHGVNLDYRQIQRLLARYKADATVFSCASRRRGRKEGSRALSLATEQAIADALKKAGKIQEAITLKRVMELVEEGCKQRGAKPPSKNALTKRMKASGFSLRKRRQYGPTSDASNSKVHGGEHKITAPLDQVQIDHTKVDLKVVDADGGVIFRRPWLTLVIDIYTRVILGFYLSIRAPGIHSVSRALLMACLPKDEVLRSLNIELEWPTYGKPKEAHTDNASEFHSKAYCRGCENQNIRHVNRPLGRKHWGGHIERVIGTNMSEVHLLPGTTFSNSKKRGDYKSDEKACLTMDELARWLTLNIIEYNNTVHRELDESPFQRWKSYWAAKGGQKIEHKILNETKFYLDFLEELEGKVQKNGIHWGTKVYMGPPLRKYRVGEPFKAKVDRTNTRQMFLMESDGDIVVLPRRTDARYDDFELETAYRRSMRERSENPHAVSQRKLARAQKNDIRRTAEERRDQRAKAKIAQNVPVPEAIAALTVPTASLGTSAKPQSLGAGSFVKPAVVRRVSIR